MEDEGEEPFVALDSLLEVNLVEDTSGCSPTHSKGDSSKDCGQENKILPENAVNSSVSYGKNTGVNDCMPYSHLDAVQIAWGMDLEEDTFYKDLFKDVSLVRFLRLHCTVCDTHLGCKPGSVLMRHVRLGTLVCKDCFTFYGAGEFPIAADGSESFCYWCGQGGSVICCSMCSAVFCKKCIRLNYTKSMIREIESSNEWLCFVCNYRSLWEHRAVCRAAITYESSNDSVKGNEAENESPGYNEDLCCGPTCERRLPRLKSSMPSAVSFVEYIKAGRVKVSVMKMLRNVPVTENVSECISLDPDEACKTEKVISTDTQNKILTHSGASKEMVSSERSVMANHSIRARGHVRVASRNIPCFDMGGIGPLNSQTRFSSIHAQPTTGLPFINQGIRPNYISSSHVIPTGRVVMMPPVHIPHRTSVIRLPAAGATAAQQNSPVDALSLGALLSSSPPVGSVPQPPNPVFRFQNGTPPFVVVSDSNRMSGVPVVVRNSSGAYVPMYVNNTANLHYIPTESSQINAVPHYVQNQGAMSYPNQQQEKSENRMSFHHSSVINNETTSQVTVNGQTSQNVSVATLTQTANSNSAVQEKSKTKGKYIQVRSPTALQSVTVSDIEHSVPEVRESVTCAVPEQQSVHNPLLPGTVPSALTSLAREQSEHNSELAESHLQNPLASRLTPSATNSDDTSLLKNILTDVARFNTSDTGADSASPINDTFSSKEIPQAPVVNQICQDLALSSPEAIETKWFKENLLEAENVAKYMLTRIMCVQEELDRKSSQKQSYGDLVNHFSKLLEIAAKKLTDVSGSFTANLQKWKGFSTSCQADLSQRSCTSNEKQSNVETNNGQKTSADDVHNNNNISHEEVEIVSVKSTGNRSSRKRCNSGSEISPPVTCAVKRGPGSAVKRGPGSAQDSTASVICTDSSEVDSQVVKPKNVTFPPPRMSTRRSKAYRGSAKFAAKCCMSSCISDLQVHNKRMDTQKNMKSSHNRSGRLLGQAKYIHIPEKRRNLKQVRIVLERINSPGKMTCKREVDDSNVINHSTNDSNAQSLEAVAVLKDRSYLGPDAFIKQLKPCSVVLHRLDHRDITHCI